MVESWTHSSRAWLSLTAHARYVYCATALSCIRSRSLSSRPVKDFIGRCGMMSSFRPITVPDSPRHIGEGTASSPILVGDVTPGSVRVVPDSPVKVIAGEEYRYDDL